MYWFFSSSKLAKWYSLSDTNLFVLAITCHPHDGLHISTDKMIYNFNETIRFSCLDGFFLQGNPERQCLKNGTLQPPFPNCTGIENSDMHINDLLFYWTEPFYVHVIVFSTPTHEGK